MALKSKILSWGAAVAVFFVLSLLIHSLSLTVADTDSFYHIRHSWLYRTAGLWQTDFPWTQYSAIKQYASDIWYGFHFLIIPFTYFKNLLTGIEAGSIFVTLVSLLLVFWSLRLLKIKWPLFWTLFFALISADVLYRLTMLRPHPISIGLGMLLFSLLIRGNFWSIFSAAAVFSFIHLALAWIPLLAALIVIAVQWLQKFGVNWKKLLATVGGLTAGLLLRPHPWGGAKLAYIQVVDLILNKNLPIRFGRELTPFVWENFVDQLIPISIFLLTAAGFLLFIFVKKRGERLLSPQNGIPVFSSLILSIIFFTMSFTTARRANDFFVGFGVIFLGLTFTHYLAMKKVRPAAFSWKTQIIGVILLAALLYAPIKTIYRYGTYVPNAFSPERFKDAASWLEKNSRPDEIVFNIHWDRFGQLFFWNQKNYYINGMDPIFEYAYDPSLYWKNHFLHIDQFFTENGKAYVCGEIRCTRETVEDVRQVLAKDFKASYILVEKNRNPKLYNFLKTAAGFEIGFENSLEAVFKLNF